MSSTKSKPLFSIYAKADVHPISWNIQVAEVARSKVLAVQQAQLWSSGQWKNYLLKSGRQYFEYVIHCRVQSKELQRSMNRDKLFKEAASQN